MGNIIVSDTGKHYEVFERLGNGGVGFVFRAVCQEDGKTYAFKHFKPEPNNVELMVVHSNIKKNIASLIKHPLKRADGTELESFIGPIDMVSNIPGKGGFGYIMNFKDTSKYGSVFKSFKKPEIYKPDARATMEICIKIAEIIDVIHAAGKCYKDINEGNIYLDVHNNYVFVIDSDNIAPEGVRTIFGTLKYVAPEVYVTETPNTASDRYSMAVYFYRLMVGGYPLDGKKTVKYLVENQLDGDKFFASKKVYSDTALFAFDENDDSNSIENVTDKDIPDDYKRLWRVQCIYWNLLPKNIKDMFQRAFSKNLLGAAKDRRPSEKQWIALFDEVLEKGIVKCSCGKHNYYGNRTCMFCGKDISKLSVTPCPRANRTTVQPVIEATTNSAYNGVKFKLLVSGAEKEIKGKEINGKNVFSDLFPTDKTILSVISYDKNEKMMKCKNTSGYRWSLFHPNGKKLDIVNGASFYLMKDSVIDILISPTASKRLASADFVVI